MMVQPDVFRPPLTGACLALILGSCAIPESTEYEATIRRTAYGIPHIVAEDWGSLGFGEGYAIAEDHLCSLVDQAIRVRSERAKYFGAGKNDAHLISDVALAALDIRKLAAQDLAVFPAHIRAMFEGYAAGVNRYLQEVGVDGVPGWCRGESWVGEIDAVDVMAYGRSLFMITPRFAQPIAAARPPSGDIASVGGDLPEMVGASNGWGIGSERSETGGGMLLANPHYPWVGSNRFWEKQLTIPGEIDAYGVGLLGLPGVALGFNENVAWTHTVSSGVRYTMYRVRLAKGNPTTYIYDGRERAMETREILVQVLREDGTVEEVRQTMYRTHHGPMVSLPGFAWTDEFAYAIRDANEDNEEVALQWTAMSQASSMDAFQEAHSRFAGMPWVNTISASADGRAWYVDVSSTPHLSDEALELWEELADTDPTVGAALARRVILLDGSDPRFEWVDDGDARNPGLLSFSALPQLERRDYVFNANDSYWLANSSQLLTGYNRLHALQEETVRSPRTRMNDVVLSDRSPSGPAGSDGKFSLEELTAAAFLNRSYTAELLAPDLAARCRAHPTVRLNGRTVRLDEACAVLAQFDGRLDLESRGAVLWREFITGFDGDDLLGSGVLFAEPFDPDDPIGTPRGLAPYQGSDDAVLQALARAVGVLQRAGFALDVALGELQHSNKNGGRIPIHGGQGFWEGVTNYANYARNGTTLEPDPALAPRVSGSRFLREDGYPVNRGTSFIMALEYAPDGPRAMALLTYSQSGDPDSPHFTDQTRLFSRKEWRPIPFSDAEIEADPALRTYTVSGVRW